MLSPHPFGRQRMQSVVYNQLAIGFCIKYEEHISFVQTNHWVYVRYGYA